MKSVTRKRKYKIINKFKFMRFIICSLICLSLLIWLFVSLISATCQMVFRHDELATIDNITNVEIVEVIPVTNNVYAAESIEPIIEEVNHTTDYSNKPDTLKEEYYDIIVNISKEENVPLEVILAIITTENVTYNINATYKNTNGTVDMGLCQINSSYVEYFAKVYNIENLDPYNVSDAVTFVARHMKYLSDYGKTHYNLSDSDSYIFAAGAYNRGLGGECKYRNMYDYKEKFINNYNKFI